MNLAELIAATRGDRTQTDLARDAGMSIQSLQQYVSGAYPTKNFPDSKNLVGLAKALHVDVTTVITASAQTLADILGIDADTLQSKLAALLPPEAAHLTDDQIAAIRTLIIAAGGPAMRATQDAPAKRPRTPRPRT